MIKERKRILVTAIVITVIFVAGMIINLAFDPERVDRFAGVATSPSAIVVESDTDAPQPRLPLQQGDRPQRDRPRKFPGVILGLSLGILGMITIFAKWRSIKPLGRAFLLAASLTTLFLAFPLFQESFSQRLALMAFIPGSVPLAYLAANSLRGTLISAVFAAVTIIVTMTGVLGYTDENQQVITLPQFHELQSFRNDLPQGKTIVIARHGLEWWAAWTMNTHVASHSGAAFEVWDEYDAVLQLTELSRGRGFDKSAPMILRPDPDAGRFSPPSTPPDDFLDRRAPGQKNNVSSQQNQKTVRAGSFYRLSRITRLPEFHRLK